VEHRGGKSPKPRIRLSKDGILLFIPNTDKFFLLVKTFKEILEFQYAWQDMSIKRNIIIGGSEPQASRVSPV